MDNFFQNGDMESSQKMVAIVVVTVTLFYFFWDCILTDELEFVVRFLDKPPNQQNNRPSYQARLPDVRGVHRGSIVWSKSCQEQRHDVNFTLSQTVKNNSGRSVRALVLEFQRGI